MTKRCHRASEQTSKQQLDQKSQGPSGRLHIYPIPPTPLTHQPFHHHHHHRQIGQQRARRTQAFSRGLFIGAHRRLTAPRPGLPSAAAERRQQVITREGEHTHRDGRGQAASPITSQPLCNCATACWAGCCWGPHPKRRLSSSLADPRSAHHHQSPPGLTPPLPICNTHTSMPFRQPEPSSSSTPVSGSGSSSNSTARGSRGSGGDVMPDRVPLVVRHRRAHHFHYTDQGADVEEGAQAGRGGPDMAPMSPRVVVTVGGGGGGSGKPPASPVAAGLMTPRARQAALAAGKSPKAGGGGGAPAARPPPHLSSSWPWILFGSLTLTFNAGYINMLTLHTVAAMPSAHVTGACVRAARAVRARARDAWCCRRPHRRRGMTDVTSTPVSFFHQQQHRHGGPRVQPAGHGRLPPVRHLRHRLLVLCGGRLPRGLNHQLRNVRNHLCNCHYRINPLSHSSLLAFPLPGSTWAATTAARSS